MHSPDHDSRRPLSNVSNSEPDDQGPRNGRLNWRVHIWGRNTSRLTQKRAQFTVRPVEKGLRTCSVGRNWYKTRRVITWKRFSAVSSSRMTFYCGSYLPQRPRSSGFTESISVLERMHLYGGTRHPTGLCQRHCILLVMWKKLWQQVAEVVLTQIHVDFHVKILHGFGSENDGFQGCCR